jgi:polyphosphate kinase
LPAPKILKKALLEKIARETGAHQEAQPGLIRFKMNALEDVEIVRALYRASQAGVRVELLVRDSCRLRPGIPGLSENIRVVSIVGRFLEHARIYYFRNAGNEEYFIGSADAMTRSLEHRVEILAPVLSSSLCEQLGEIFDLQFNDRRFSWELLSDGRYQKPALAGDRSTEGCQERLIRLAEKRSHEAQRLRKRKAQSAPVNLQLDD